MRKRPGSGKPSREVEPEAPKRTSRATKPKRTVKETQRARTAAQLERQFKAFQMSVLGKGSRAIAVELGVKDHRTILRDIHAEARRRAVELGERRETEKARSMSAYEAIMEKGIDLASRPFGERGLDSAIKARERMDKLLGLDEAVKVDMGIQPLLDALNDHD